MTPEEINTLAASLEAGHDEYTVLSFARQVAAAAIASPRKAPTRDEAAAQKRFIVALALTQANLAADQAHRARQAATWNANEAANNTGKESIRHHWRATVEAANEAANAARNAAAWHTVAVILSHGSTELENPTIRAEMYARQADQARDKADAAQLRAN